ncbi:MULTISPECIES: PBP1A family penicillin-binding protein [Sutcliffiella]|uniref:Fibronectin type-III domain-containing protein n=1 Tax=Sutcliffiella cohnii TaxID=33932 RepID=A0A223KQ18_9BACI|nr:MULTISPECIES: PBP1A family penicillin-binding protein [Sutcliffiella]AST91600.1 hypothetical protein BC6307_10055 [Sutcliffiella cohnii]WBL17430.1 PBP1A family penicillin-binding protein [Sutcliffiella sp. NC1]
MSEQYKSREQRRKALEEKKNKKNGKKSAKGLVKKTFLALVLVGLIGLLIGIGTFAYFVKDTPPLDETLLKVPVPSKVMDKNGELAAEIGGNEARDYVNYDDIPQLVIDAFLATEDVRFFEHNGIDYRRLGGAVLANVSRGFGAEGGSTITQQLVKLSFLTEEKKLSRKAQEAYLAYQLESRFTKEEILEMYLNRIYFSNRAYGIARAAQNYYGKKLDELELHEVATLAGLPQSPNNYNPVKYPENAERRRNIVLTLMVKHGKITEAEADEARAVEITSTLVDGTNAPTFSNRYNAFVDQVVEELQEKLGENIDPRSDGLVIHTTLDTKAQEQVEFLLSDEGPVPHVDNEDYQSGIALVDTKTGQIRALGGGRNYVKTGYNYATDTRVQPGSAIKPILDFGPAVEYLNWSTYHQIKDEPYTYSDANKTPIQNWDRKHEGWLTMRQALARSRNIPALKAFQEVGSERAREFAVNLGIPLEETIHESYSIGGFKTGVSPLQLAGAYAAFGNEGIYTEPYAVSKVQFPDGTSVNLANESKVGMKDSTAFMISDVLKTAMTSGGTGRLAQVPGLHIAGKTGTTNFDQNDLATYNVPSGAAPSTWFAGYTPTYSIAVWNGFSKMGEGNFLRSPTQGFQDQYYSRMLFKELLQHVATTDEDKVDFRVPNSVVRVGVESGTNPPLLASEFTPKDKIIYEYFVKGTEPTTVSKEFDKVDNPKNVTAVYEEEANQIVINWDYNDDRLADISFELTAQRDNGDAQVLTVTKDLTFTIDNPEPGSTYTISITAISDENEQNRSETVTKSVQIPIIQEEEEEELEEIIPIPEPPVDEEDDGEEDGNRPPTEGINPPPRDDEEEEDVEEDVETE